ncbi:MAG: efflux RND transporter permease subunit [Xenococcaceae cyanobacterium]
MGSIQACQLRVSITGQKELSVVWAVLSKAAEEIEDILETVPNVRKVDLSGNREEVIHVQLLPSRMKTLGVSATQVANAIPKGNLDLPWERVDSDEIGTQLRYYGKFRSLDDLRNLPVTRLGGERDGRVVTLQEVAEEGGDPIEVELIGTDLVIPCLYLLLTPNHLVADFE